MFLLLFESSGGLKSSQAGQAINQWPATQIYYSGWLKPVQCYRTVYIAFCNVVGSSADLFKFREHVRGIVIIITIIINHIISIIQKKQYLNPSLIITRPWLSLP